MIAIVRAFTFELRSVLRAQIVLSLTLSAMLSASLARADNLLVVSSGGFAQAYTELATPFLQKNPDIKAELQRGPSMGETANAIPKRLERGEPVDVVIMVGSSLDELMAQGKLLPGSKVVLAKSLIAVAVKAGASKPDISNKDALVKTLLAAKSIAYSDSASGEYLSNELFPRLGIAEQMKTKARQIPAIPVGEVVASGQAEIGFQQYSELLPIKGIDIVGKLSDDVQKETLFSAAIVANSKHVESAKKLLAFISSSEVQPIVRKTGLDSMPGR
jgi:molybdate transport system substrate-binding protein